MAYTPFNYNPYAFGGYQSVPVRPDMQMGQVYPQPQNVAPAPPVGQSQGISPVSRPVTSKEEAMGIAADFSGAPMIFPDMAHNVIFVKRWDYQSGSAVFTEYVPKNAPPTPSEDTPAGYATQNDFKELAERLTERLEDIEADIERLKKKGAKKIDDE